MAHKACFSGVVPNVKDNFVRMEKQIEDKGSSQYGTRPITLERI